MSTTPPTPIESQGDPFSSLAGGRDSKTNIASVAEDIRGASEDTVKGRFGALFAKARRGRSSAR